MTTLDLSALKAIRDKLPNGGAILSVHDGKLSNPMVILETFPSSRSATKALKAAGFKSLGQNRWK